MGCKWNTTFRFVPLENSRKKRTTWKGSPVFPVEIFPMEMCVPFTNFSSFWPVPILSRSVFQPGLSCCPQTKMAGEVPLSFEADLQGLFQCGDCHMLLANLESYLHHDCASCVNGMYNFGQFLANPKLSLSKIFARKMLHLRASLFHPKFLFFVSFFVFS